MPFAVYQTLPLASVALGLLGMSFGVADVVRSIADAPIPFVSSALARGMSIAEITEVRPS